MSNSYVSLVRCEDYNAQKVLQSVRRAIDLLGGMEKFISPGQKVFLKPNLLRAANPERHITTHFQVVHAVVSLLKEIQCQVIIADSPGIPPYDEPSRLYTASRLDEVAEELGASLNQDTGYSMVDAPQAKMIRRFPIINPALDADAIVVVSKAKTHLFTAMTGAAKNMFGVVSGAEKSKMHARFQEVDDFSDMIIDLNQLMSPKLQIMDAIVGLEGDGPSAGIPRKIGAILASSDYNAIDVVTSRLMSFDPREISTIRAAMRRGLLKEDISNVIILGDTLEELIVKDFRKPSTRIDPPKGHLSAMINVLFRHCAAKPVIIAQECKGCEICYHVCPKKTIKMSHKIARIERKNCIRCFCCHEMCPSNAIVLQRSILGKLMAAVRNRSIEK
jgi:uncharacterized protein (DUF362 family)/Pyruvate/2-oxoacid:ferredoxin oxidoreductase delta subunit